MPTVTDFFCGMGGSSTGLVGAGFELRLAANHWDRAIETHAANHPGVEHLCADLQAVDLRYLPSTDALWASPICTELSPAGGRRRSPAQPGLFEEHGHVASAAFERSRVTFWEVIRAVEIHRYKVILVENVVEAAAWELFDVWLAGMTRLGYEHQFVSVSAAHVGDNVVIPRAPQWRDRLYIVFHRVGMRRPDVEPRPQAWCPECGSDVAARQWWKKPGRRIGKYRRQYHYVCPVLGHGVVEPHVSPAARAIDWTNLGERIGDRAKPLAAATIRRIQHGLDRFHAGELDPPAGGSPEGFVVKSQGGYLTAARAISPTWQPLPTTRATAADMLVLPYRRGSRPHLATTAPLSTMSTKDTHSLITPAPTLTDCRFRMLTPGEAARAQAFPASYIIHGNKGERQMQAGNAVAVNVAHWLGHQTLAIL